MPKYYSKTLKLISIITLAAFIATQCGLSYASDFQSCPTTSKLRQLQETERLAEGKAKASGNEKALVELFKKVCVEIDAASYWNKPTGKERIAAYRDFIMSQAERLGVPVQEKFLTYKEFILHILSMLKRDPLSAFGELIYQMAPANAGMFWDKEGSLKRIQYSPRAKAYSGIFVMFAAGILLAFYLPFVGGILVIFAVSMVLQFLLSNGRGHELTHIYQFFLLERIRRELGIQYSHRTLYYAVNGKSSIGSMDVSLFSRYINDAPPSPYQLRGIALDIFAGLYQYKDAILEQTGQGEAQGDAKGAGASSNLADLTRLGSGGLAANSSDSGQADAKGGGLDPKTQSDILNSAEETYEEIGNKFGIDSGLIYWQPLCKRVSEILAHKLSALGYEVEVVISYWSLERDGHYFIILQRNDEYWVIDAVWQQVVDEARLNPLKKVLIIKAFDKGAVFDADRFIDALTKFGLPSEDKEYIIFDVWLYALRRKNAEQRQTQADAKGDAKGADDNARLKFDLVQNIDMGLWKSQIEDVSQKFPPTYFKNYILYTMSSDNGITIIAHRGNELLGYITGGRLEECDLYDRNFGSDSSVFITGILVKKGLRGGGLGRTLLARFIRESRKRGYKFLSTYTISARLVHLLRDMPATPCLEEYDIGGYTFVTLVLSGSALPPLDKRWIFIKSLGKIARLTVLHKIRKGGSIEDAKAELRRLAIPARQSLAEAEAKGQAQAVGAEIEQSITEFLDDLNKLKEQFRITMTPDPKIEAALPQGDPDFEWVFATLLRGNAYWYDYFPDMYGIVLSRGVSDDMLNSGSSNNIFDKFAVNYGEISRRFIRSLEELGYSKQSNFKYSYFVTDNRNLQPAEITRKFVKEFGVPNQDIVTVRYERDPRLKDKVAVVITQRRDDGIISIKEDLLRKGFAIWNIINVQVYPDDYKCLQDGDLRAINRILEEARKMAGEREIFVVINVLKIDNEALANNLTKICDLVLSQNELEDQKLRDKIEAQAVGAAA